MPHLRIFFHWAFTKWESSTKKLSRFLFTLSKTQTHPSTNHVAGKFYEWKYIENCNFSLVVSNFIFKHTSREMQKSCVAKSKTNVSRWLSSLSVSHVCDCSQFCECQKFLFFYYNLKFKWKKIVNENIQKKLWGSLISNCSTYSYIFVWILFNMHVNYFAKCLQSSLFC